MIKSEIVGRLECNNASAIKAGQLTPHCGGCTNKKLGCNRWRDQPAGLCDNYNPQIQEGTRIIAHKFRVRKTDDAENTWAVADGSDFASTRNYINDKGEITTICSEFQTKEWAEIALGHYESKQNSTGAVMTLERFDRLIDYIVEQRIKKVICAKNKEYSPGGNKIHNFDHAGQIRNISAMEALRGMKLKHETSIDDMLNGLEEGKTYPRESWEEKFTDNISYQILQWVILARDNNWGVLR